jgi:hypothetical protein
MMGSVLFIISLRSKKLWQAKLWKKENKRKLGIDQANFVQELGSSILNDRKNRLVVKECPTYRSGPELIA